MVRSVWAIPLGKFLNEFHSGSIAGLGFIVKSLWPSKYSMIVIFNDSPQYPNRSIGAYRIATVLRRYGLEVEVIDYMTAWEKTAKKELFKYLDAIPNVEWWGFSTRFDVPTKIMSANSTVEQTWFLGTIDSDPQFELDVIGYIKSRGGKIVLGGPNAFILSKRLPAGMIDYLCHGYSDTGVIAVHEHITSGNTLIATKQQDFLVVDCDNDYKDTDLATIDVDYHHTDFLKNDIVFPVEISRGCIFQCAFCSYPHTGKKPGTYIRPKKSIKKDIVDRYTNYGATKFLFLDDTFNDSIEKMEMIREIREETGIPFEFWSYARLDLLRVHPRMVDLIGEIGWTSMTFGVETFNRSSGKAIGKGADPEKLKSFLLELRSRYPNIFLQIHMIIGLPDDTEESARETYQWFVDNPGIANQLTINKLNIQKPDDKQYSSKISKSPEKYGYEVKKSEPQVILINWINKNGMSQRRARDLAQELSDHYESIKDNLETVTHTRSMIPGHFIKQADGTYINTMLHIPDLYIANKLSYRNIIR
jgi:radical SAM superfamily enzyme YgiQ (UPF0313 family)